ncbi:hypothetical protein PMAYCL1PPCAC_02051, partial [Pristionchus mayeri]
HSAQLCLYRFHRLLLQSHSDDSSHPCGFSSSLHLPWTVHTDHGVCLSFGWVIPIVFSYPVPSQAYTVMLHTFAHSLYLIIVSFSYRLYVLKRPGDSQSPSRFRL